MFNLFGKKKTAPGISVATAMNGVIIDLAQVPDPVFSGKMVGDGFAIEPISGDVLAPVTGELVQLFPTKHAFGLRTAEGLEILVHVGIDTVQLKGEGFTAHAAVGDQVTQGQKILSVDLAHLEAAGKSTVTPVIITNMTEVTGFEWAADLIGKLQTAPTAVLNITVK